MVKRQVGRQAFFRGKSLFELCCNLKNFGANRIVYRNPKPDLIEKSFYRLTRVEPDMNSVSFPTCCIYMCVCVHNSYITWIFFSVKLMKLHEVVLLFLRVSLLSSFSCISSVHIYVFIFLCPLFSVALFKHLTFSVHDPWLVQTSKQEVGVAYTFQLAGYSVS